MSKRKNMQARRRQIRRTLNNAEDTIQRVGMSKVNSIGYGCGLSRGDVRGELKGRRLEKNEDYEVIY